MGSPRARTGRVIDDTFAYFARFSWFTLLFGLAVCAPILAILVLLLAERPSLELFSVVAAFLHTVLLFGGGAWVKWRHSRREIDAAILAAEKANFPLHPDPDVDSLLRKEIDLAEYARRKDLRAGGSPR